MDEIVSTNSDERQAKKLEVAHYSWLSDEEEELFDRSGFEKVADWVKSFYGVSVEFWMDTKETTRILQQSAPSVRQKSSPLPTYKDILSAHAKKREIGELKRLKRYVRIESDNEIIMTKLSRELHSGEVNFHRSDNCAFLGSCAIFASKNKIYHFSCINCPKQNT